jgi:soluble lytic murein transglycosylase-like protein
MKTLLVKALSLLALILAYHHCVEAEELYIKVEKAALRHGIDPMLYFNILQVESELDQNAFNASTHDYGIAQINHKTAVLYKFSVQKLKTDVDYNLNAGAIILRDVQKSFKAKEPLTWYCRYNIGYGKLSKKAKACKSYLAKITRVQELAKLKLVNN